MARVQLTCSCGSSIDMGWGAGILSAFGIVAAEPDALARFQDDHRRCCVSGGGGKPLPPLPPKVIPADPGVGRRTR